MQSSSAGPSSAATNVVTVLAIVLALIGVGGVASGAADKPAENVASTGGTTTTSFVTNSTVDSSGVSGGTTTTLVGGTTATTTKTGSGSTATTAKSGAAAAACPTPPAASADPAASHTPPAAGTYTYADCSDSSDTSEERVALGTSAGNVSRREVTGQEAGSQATSTIAYRPDGVFVEAIKFQSPQGAFTCDVNPDVLNYPAVLKVGAEWSGKGSCDLKQSGSVASPGKVSVEGKGKITGKVAYNVGGTTVNAWTIEGTVDLTITISAFGEQKAHIEEFAYYDPSRGVDLFRRSTSSGEGQSFTTEQRLTSLTPKP